MYKLNFELGEVNKSLRMKFSLVLRNNLNRECVSKFTVGGDEFLRISPYPSIVLEIYDEVEKAKRTWNPNHMVSLNRFGRYRFVREGEVLLKTFVEEKELFYYEGEILKTNQTIAKKNMKLIRLPQKNVLLLPVVVEDPETKRLFEGVSMMVNNISEYCTMTYDEFSFLITYLKEFDFDTVSLQMINTAAILQGTEFKKLENSYLEGIEKQSTEQKDEGTVTGYLIPKQEDTIPNI